MKREMDTAGFYHQGTSVTHLLAESPFQTPPSAHPAHLHASSLSQYGRPFVGPASHSDLSSVNQKLDRVLAVALEQRETGTKCKVMYQHDCLFSFSCKTRTRNI